MSDDRVSYMYQRDPSVDRRYRPRPNNVRDLFKDITEDEELDGNTQTVNCANSQNSVGSDTVDTTASVYLRMRPSSKPCKYYNVQNNLLKVLPIENVTTNNKDLTEKHFEFSMIFQNEANQYDIYNQTVHSSIQNDECLTILTYGTSGSGKTYTMYGSENDAGIVHRAIAHIFIADERIICATPAAKIDKGNFSMVSPNNVQSELNLTAEFVREETRARNKELVKQIRDEHGFEPVTSDWQCVFVWISFAEIYNENVYDLLQNSAAKRKNLKIIANDGNTYIKDLTSVHVASASDAYDVINAGLAQVNYASTNINANSSRSHCILIVNVIHFSYPDRLSLATYKFCDLAGSERLKKTENVGNRLKEAQRINTSLMVLGRCFDLMFQNQQNKSKEVVPFRESKLTMLLQKSLLGQEKITTIVTMAPKVEFLDENLQVLNFASIAQQIVFKQPKRELRNRRAAKSTRLSWFMDTAIVRDESDYEIIVSENERLDRENADLHAEVDSLRELIQQMTLDHAKEEQMLRNKLVEEREAQMKTASEKWQRRIDFVEKRSKMRVSVTTANSAAFPKK